MEMRMFSYTVAIFISSVNFLSLSFVFFFFFFTPSGEELSLFGTLEISIVYRCVAFDK